MLNLSFDLIINITVYYSVVCHSKRLFYQCCINVYLFVYSVNEGPVESAKRTFKTSIFKVKCYGFVLASIIQIFCRIWDRLLHSCDPNQEQATVHIWLIRSEIWNTCMFSLCNEYICKNNISPKTAERGLRLCPLTRLNIIHLSDNMFSAKSQNWFRSVWLISRRLIFGIFFFT